MTKKRKFFSGKHRWWVLLFILLGILSCALSTWIPMLKPVQPHLQVAPEKLIEEPLFTLPVLGDFYLFNTLPTLILTLILIFVLAYAIKRSAQRMEKDLVPRGLAGAFEALVETLYNMTENSAGAKFAKQIFPWFAAFMIYVLFANLLKIIPGFETIGIMHHATEGGHDIQGLFGNWYTLLAGDAHGEGYVLTPFLRGISVDLNFTLGLALISVFMTQVIGFRAQGWGYLLKFANVRTLFSKPFFGAMDFLVGLLELISEFSKIISFAFRLFGNMFAGVVLVALIGSMLPVFLPSFIYLFEFFIGLIQAFVFGMLTMVFMSMVTHSHGGEEHAEAH